MIIQDQIAYLRKDEELKISLHYKEFCSGRVEMAWLSKHRPECVLEIF